MECVFFDSDAQYITKESTSDADHILLSHGKWALSIPQKELNAFIAAHTAQNIISPLSYLFSIAKEPALYGMILDDYIYLATFQDGEPLFVKIIPREEVYDLAKAIEDFLHEFYKQEKNFFVEKIILYHLSDYILPDNLEERLLLPIQIQKEAPCVEAASRYFLHSSETLQKNSYKILKKVAGIVGILFLLLAGYDLYLRYTASIYEGKIAKLVSSQTELANKNNELQTKISWLRRMAPLIRQTKEHNSYLISFIRDIFEQIPDHSYLTFAGFFKDGLVLKGKTQEPKEIRQLDQVLSKSFREHRLILHRDTKGYRFEAIYKRMHMDNE